MQHTEDIEIIITPKSPDTRWVTVDEDNKIISEGKTPEEVIKAAKLTDKAFTVIFIPIEGNTYIF